MPLIENEDNYYYDYYGLEERVSNVETQVSEVYSNVEVVQTQISELVSVQSEQFSEYMSVQSEQVSEIVSVMNDSSVIVGDIDRHADVFITLLFVSIAFVGAVCGLMIANLIRK